MHDDIALLIVMTGGVATAVASWLVRPRGGSVRRESTHDGCRKNSSAGEGKQAPPAAGNAFYYYYFF